MRVPPATATLVCLAASADCGRRLPLKAAGRSLTRSFMRLVARVKAAGRHTPPSMPLLRLLFLLPSRMTGFRQTRRRPSGDQLEKHTGLGASFGGPSVVDASGAWWTLRGCAFSM